MTILELKIVGSPTGNADGAAEQWLLSEAETRDLGRWDDADPMRIAGRAGTSQAVRGSSTSHLHDPDGLFEWPLNRDWLDTVLRFGDRDPTPPPADGERLARLAEAATRVVRSSFAECDVVVGHGLAAVVPWLAGIRPYIVVVDAAQSPTADPLVLRACREAVSVICRTAEHAAALRCHGIHATVLPPSLEETRWRPATRVERELARKECHAGRLVLLDLSAGAPTGLIVEASKGIRLWIDSLSQEERSDIGIVIATALDDDGAYVDSLSGATKVVRVTAPETDRFASLIRACDVAVLPGASYAQVEPLVIRAAACGIPIVGRWGSGMAPIGAPVAGAGDAEEVARQISQAVIPPRAGADAAVEWFRQERSGSALTDRMIEMAVEAASRGRLPTSGFDSLRQKRLELQYEAASADDYDAKYHGALCYRMMDSRIADTIESALGREARSTSFRLLDVGCGPGSLIPVLSAIPGAKVVGIDLSPEMIALARRKHPNAEFEVGDVESLQFADESFDVVLCSGMLHHLPSLTGALGEISRVLRPNGLLVAREPNLDNFATRHPEAAFAHLCLMHALYYGMNADRVYEPDSHDYHRDFELQELAETIGQRFVIDRLWTDLRVSYFYEMLTDPSHESALRALEETLQGVPGMNGLILARKPAPGEQPGLSTASAQALTSMLPRNRIPESHFTALMDVARGLLRRYPLMALPDDESLARDGVRSILPWLRRAKKIVAVMDQNDRLLDELPRTIANRIEVIEFSNVPRTPAAVFADCCIISTEGARDLGQIERAAELCRPHGMRFIRFGRRAMVDGLQGGSETFLDTPIIAAARCRHEVTAVMAPLLFTKLDFYKALNVAMEVELVRGVDRTDRSAALRSAAAAMLRREGMRKGYSHLRALEHGRLLRRTLDTPVGVAVEDE